VAFEQTMSALYRRSNWVYRRVFHTLITERMGRSLAVLKADGLSIREQIILLRMYLPRYAGYPAFWMKVVPMFLVPNALLRTIRVIYFRIASGQQSARAREAQGTREVR
jgi:hypothetical protein